jgi:hypothetical protein
MYRKASDGQLEFEDFYLPFGGKLRSDNRWVILPKISWYLAMDKNTLGIATCNERVLGSCRVLQQTLNSRFFSIVNGE